MTEKRAWVVEQDPRVAGTIIGTLVSCGYSAEIFASGQEALCACEKNGGADLVVIGAISDMEGCRLAAQLNMILRATILRIPNDISHLADELTAIIQQLEEQSNLFEAPEGWVVFTRRPRAT